MKQLEQGMGMLEVAVTLMLLSVGMLGFAALQTASVKSTNESIDRIKALTVMQSAAEKIRTNPSAMTAYKQGFKQMTTRADVVKKATAPANMCGLDGSSTAQPCTPANLAQVEVHLFAKQLLGSSLVANIVACPRNNGNNNNIGNSDCMIVAWDNTSPTIGTNVNSNCLSPAGFYHPSASCIFMEIN